MARWNEAQVTEGKILEYLLSADHPTGKDKAAFFAAVGYSREEWNQLRDDLLGLARAGDVVAETPTEYGMKYVLDGVLQTPVGRAVALRTVWIADEPEDPPRLVTAYPRRGDS